MTDVAGSYDPTARRETPLALQIKEMIRREGPISVHRYVSLCLQDPERGYYRHRQAIGRQGDFITAPEISQVFGELIGLWSVVVWRQMGMPDPFHLIELGPGRGTLMRDALRAARLAPAFLKAAQVVLVETNATLREQQKATLADLENIMTCCDTLDAVPDAPSIIIANEFLDAIAPVQSVVTADGIRERGVGLDVSGQLQFVSLTKSHGWRHHASGEVGAIYEDQDIASLTRGLGRNARDHPQVALLIDYGHVTGEQGDTLQAVRQHKYEHPLTSPGEADLSVHVNFRQAAEQIKVAQDAFEQEPIELAIDGPITQAEFLSALGIVERAQKLMAANPTEANAIETAIARLIAPNGMGTRFKVMGVRSPQLPPLPGFPVTTPSVRTQVR